MSAMKRQLNEDASSAKRTRMVVLPRLCDLPKGEAAFANAHNAITAREKGILRSREAKAKYEELEKKLISLFKDSGDLDFPDEDWVFEVCPELNDLEADTLDALLAQAQQHARYERAARDLLLEERAKLERAHENDLRSVKAQLESDLERRERTTELRVKGLEEGAQEELDELRTEAQEKIRELEELIEELQEKNEAQEKRIAEVEAEAEEECERLREEGSAILAKLEEAQHETDLKRQTSRKLKEEIIDNDRLTVANLNRIKALESLLDQHKAALAESEEENEALKEELAKTVQLGRDSEESDEEIATLREMLAERENQLMALSQRLSERESARDIYGGGASENRRRDSFLDRLPFKSFSTNA